MKKSNNLLFVCFFTLVLSSCQKETIISDSNNLSGLSNSNSISVAVAKSDLVRNNFSLNNWMKNIDNSINISAISIPGTHDAGSRYEALNRFPLLQKLLGSTIKGTAKCQNLSIDEQLNIGVRYLDMRCKNMGSSFKIYHGFVDQKLSFESVVKSCENFLIRNPSETIIMGIAEEDSNTKQAFENLLLSYISSKPNLWYTANNLPTLGTVRGKIVLERDFTSTKNIGIGNSYKTSQDVYIVKNNDYKWGVIYSFLSDTYLGKMPNKLVLNCTNGYKPKTYKIWFYTSPEIPDIDDVSDYINPKLLEYFRDSPRNFYGIIQTDFMTAELSKRIIKTNF